MFNKFRRHIFSYCLILLISFYFLPANLFAQPARQSNSYKAGGEEKITNEQIYRELKIFEAKTEERFKAVDQRFEMIDKRIDNLYTFMWILASIFTAMFISFTGLLLWDRKTIVEVSVKKSFDKVESEGTSKKLLDALRELAKEDKKIAEVLKNFNLL